ncbi:DUF488 family protein [Crenobacter sp. SG2305]|uniref:DUF488 domain-containing protein n=1 Tax=Crenobacter oryzisoli TaxID=3056844 RepID=UPI0025AA8DFC|nr:DUF488 family protein [Crenobacter sp. SG2305]MDN0083480.1 DUF488 family protein [Crenobacter sp. SG2305]
MPSRIHLVRVYDLPPGTQNAFLVDRLWPRGISKAELKNVRWLKDAAPTDELRRWLHEQPERWPTFCQKYWQELLAHPEHVQPLLGAARQGDVTLVYASRDTEHNNAQVLKQFLEAQLTADDPGIELASPVCYASEFDKGPEHNA